MGSCFSDTKNEGNTATQQSKAQQQAQLQKQEIPSNIPKDCDPESPWKLYEELIDGLPEGILVKDYCLGRRWSYLEAESGIGVSLTTSGGAKRCQNLDLRGRSLREVARLATSWNLEESTLGIAALNAWYSQKERLASFNPLYDDIGFQTEGALKKMDAFEMYRPQMREKNVTVVGHFPNVERIAGYANLTVLERSCTRENDTPDPACEYILGEQDFVFITGVTLTNKTAPRLLELAKNATLVLIGPSVVPSPSLFDRGVDMLAGSVVVDDDLLKYVVRSCSGRIFGEALQMFSMTNLSE